MFGFFVIGGLAAFGLVCALWALLGWLLPGGKGCALVCFGLPDEEILTRSKWLRDIGWLDVPLLIVAEEFVGIPPGTEICSREELVPRLEWERNRYYGTGNGDHSGRDQCRGVSEL